MEKVTITTSKKQYDYLLDDIDDFEQMFAEFIQYYTNKKNSQKQYKQSTGVFDEFFGTLKSDKSVSLEDMNTTIAMRGGRL